jgi:Type VI secretion system effector, Hcp
VELQIIKGIDKASPGLLLSTIQGQVHDEVTLTGRTSGEAAIDQFRLILRQARVLRLSLTDSAGTTPAAMETLDSGRRRWPQRRPAVAAEVARRRVGAPARRADDGEPRTALPAELIAPALSCWHRGHFKASASALASLRSALDEGQGWSCAGLLC